MLIVSHVACFYTFTITQRTMYHYYYCYTTYKLYNSFIKHIRE